MINRVCVQPALGYDKLCSKYDEATLCEECLPGYKLS